VPLVCD